MYRLDVVEIFLNSSVVLAKVDFLWSLLVRNGTRLASRSTLSRMIPIVLEPEKAGVTEKLSP